MRLKIIKRLIRAGHQGVPVGSLQKDCEIPNSTLSHHISKLINIDIVKQNRKGRTLYCVVSYDKLDAIKVFLEKDCCLDEK